MFCVSPIEIHIDIPCDDICTQSINKLQLAQRLESFIISHKNDKYLENIVQNEIEKKHGIRYI